MAGSLSLTWAATSNLPLDHPYTLRNPEPFQVEKEYHRMIAEGRPRSFILPRPCERDLDSSLVCAETGAWAFRDSARGQRMTLSPVGGYEYRYLQENVNAFDLGLAVAGSTGPVAIRLDARMFTELHDRRDHPSFDREGLDRQDEQQSGSIAYSSYSRYRTTLSYDWSWGRLTAGRDAAHWGPGLYSNLVFKQESVPFNQLTFTTRLGPFVFHSLYGQLTIGDDWESNTSTDTRSVYAHRYEWQPWPDLLFGVSEQLILHNASVPFAFIPVVPLFIAKYSEKERTNNGNIAADVSLRFAGIAHLYSEFLIDDLQSPGTLFGDHWGNKWGWLAGAHFILSERGPETGAILEYARIEPWVYTHYLPNTAQTANLNHPLGNQDGPNSQSLRAKVYARGGAGWYVGLKAEALWKGSDTGTSVLDNHPETGFETKAFLGGDPEAEWSAAPHMAYRWRYLSVFFKAEWGLRTRLVAGGGQVAY